MKQPAFLLLLLLITATIAFKTGHVLISDSVAFTFGLRVGAFDAVPIEVLEGKPLVLEEALPGVWSDYGIVKLTKTIAGANNFHMHTKKISGSVCRDVDIKLEISESLDGEWTEIYTGKLDNINSEKNKISLVPTDSQINSFYVRQNIKLNESADKNDEGKVCEWNEVLAYSGAGKMFDRSLTITRNKLSAWYWIQPGAKVKSPNGGEKYKAGDTTTIKWKAFNPSHDKEISITVDIYLFDSSDGNVFLTIAEDVENTGTYEWAIPENLDGKYLVKIFVVESSGLSTEDFSDASFTIIGVENKSASKESVLKEPEVEDLGLITEPFPLPKPDAVAPPFDPGPPVLDNEYID